MSKTTFLGYVPSLKSKHEAKIVGHKAIESKGGSIRYTLQGEYQGRKTLPKTVSKADFEGIYGFDAKEAEQAVFIRGKTDGGSYGKQVAHIIGIEDADGFEPKSIIALDGKTPSSKRILDDWTEKKWEYANHADTVGSPSPASVEPPAPSEKPFPQEPSNENFSAEDYGWVITHKDSGLRTDSFRTKSQAEKYRDGLKQNKTLRTGMKIVKANSNDEAITPNILNYLDKLELTDIEEEQAAPDDENEEKEAETYEIIKQWETAFDTAFLGDADNFEHIEILTDALEKLRLEEEEGEYPQEFLDEFYDFDSNPTADTQDEETLAIAYAAWLESKRNEENIPYQAETDYTEIYGASGSGEIDHDTIDTYEETEVHFRHDYPMTTYDWTTSKDDLTEDEEDIVDSEVRWDIGSEPSEGEDSDSIDVDGVGTVDYTKDTDYGDKRFYGLAAEHESEGDGLKASKNLKMALGITAVGIGLAAVLGKEKIKTLFDRLGL